MLVRKRSLDTLDTFISRVGKKHISYSHQSSLKLQQSQSCNRAVRNLNITRKKEGRKARPEKTWAMVVQKKSRGDMGGGGNM